MPAAISPFSFIFRCRLLLDAAAFVFHYAAADYAAFRHYAMLALIGHAATPHCLLY